MGKTPAQKKRNQYLPPCVPEGPAATTCGLSAPAGHAGAPANAEFGHRIGGLLLPRRFTGCGVRRLFPLRHGRAHPHPGRRHFATVTTLEGTELDVDLALEANKTSVAGRRLVSLAVLNAAKVRVQSWRAIVPTINRCRSHSLGPLIIRCRHLLEEHGDLAVRDLCQQLTTESTALVTGAVATLLRSREIESDVDTHLWGPGTVLRTHRHG